MRVLPQRNSADPVARTCGVIAMAGCALCAIADLLGARLSNRIGLVSDTISDLAAGGRFDWLADLGLYAFVVAVLAAAIGLGRWPLTGWDWRLGKVLLFLIAIIVTVIGAD